MRTIPELLEYALEHHAERSALAPGEPLTYAELGRRIHGLAQRLVEVGVRPGDRVAVLEDNTAGFLIVYFAAPCAGAVLQPLNLRLARPELQASLADAETRVLVAGRAHAERARELGLPVVVPEGEVADGPPGVPRASPADVAQLYYTSGTTGRPKGVMLTHANVCAHAESAVLELGLGPQDRWGHFAPMFHLADAWATFALTLAGGTHVMLPRFSAGDALDLIERERITLTNLVPTMLNAIVATPRAAIADTSSLRLVLSGGAPITPWLVRRVIETLRCDYAQTYGMTETSPFLTLGLLPDHLAGQSEAERVRRLARTGRPFRGVELEVVDEEGAAVPADDRTLGEIRVRGETISPGYWRNPEETTAVFRDGWLYTGDLATLDGEGYVDIKDRAKDMIVTGGENVYSTEVEAVLAEHPGVHEAVVFGLPDDDWGELVAAAVVRAPGAYARASELDAWCRERLAGFKAPRLVRFLSELPRTGSGKLSKRSLRDGGELPGTVAARLAMVAEQIEARGLTDLDVLMAVRSVPRHRFVPDVDPLEAYGDRPHPIGRGQTISQPYVVAFMTAALELAPGARVLEVGTGCGYQAAVLAELGCEVWSLEIVPELAEQAEARLFELGYGGVRSRRGDGHAGWPDAAPFDAILVTAAPECIPGCLVDELAIGGRLLLPLGAKRQELVLVERTPDGVMERRLLPVRFVPMTRDAGGIS